MTYLICSFLVNFCLVSNPCLFYLMPLWTAVYTDAPWLTVGLHPDKPIIKWTIASCKCILYTSPPEHHSLVYPTLNVLVTQYLKNTGYPVEYHLFILVILCLTGTCSSLPLPSITREYVPYLLTQEKIKMQNSKYHVYWRSIYWSLC